MICFPAYFDISVARPDFCETIPRYTEDLGLDAAGVECNEQGFIIVDGDQNTNIDGIYAVGDVTGRMALTPVAIAAALRLTDRLFGGRPERKLDYDLVPSIVFSHSPLGTIGMTEQDARKTHGGTVRIYQSRFDAGFHNPADG